MRWLCALLLVGQAGCVDDHARYDQAVQRMDQLAAQVDAGFDRVAVHNGKVFTEDSWDDRKGLVDALDAARAGMTDILADQEERIRVEEGILELAALEHSVDTRVLYHMDLDAQRAKRDLFAITLEMYEALAAEVQEDDRGAFDELSQVYRSGVEAGNQHFQELDKLRQDQQQSSARRPPSI
ncbi:MAG: hypothetical protein OEY97_04650 [Nitrospirota bacterium]|nr:hypothetical protein [Nitrospirota bacterium]